MGYFDGNTVTALWNYAQHFALSDNPFATMFGQSTRGALNLTAGDTYGVALRSDGVRLRRRPAVRRRRSSSTATAAPATARSARSSTTPIPTGTSAPRARQRRSTAATSATCSRRRESPGAGSRAASRPPPTARARAATRSRRTTARSASIPRPIRPLRRTTSRITTRSSTSPPPPTRDICRPPPWTWWADRPGQPPRTISPGSGRRPSGQLAGRLLPEGAGRPERPPRQLQPARRAGVPGRHAEPAAAAARVAAAWPSSSPGTTRTAGTTT